LSAVRTKLAPILGCICYMLWIPSRGMVKGIEKKDIRSLKKENDRIILKLFGIKYEEFFPHERQCEN
jgi:hypothetical protein